MTSEVRIERATTQSPEDSFALIEEYYEAVGVVERDDRCALLTYLSSPAAAIWVAYYASAPAGCILFRTLAHPASAGEIKRLYVRPAYRGCGVASLLLHELEAFALAAGVAWLYLDTKDDLHQAIDFYVRHGYARCARYNENPQATIFMRKALSPE
jgi:GNAT superfamily N-acetyltransferase